MADSLLLSMFGSVRGDDSAAKLVHLLSAMSSASSEFERHEQVYEPLPSDQARLHLPRLSVLRDQLSGVDSSQTIRVLGRPVAPMEHRALVRSCEDSEVVGDVRLFLAHVDYRLKFEVLRRGTVFRMGGGISAKVFRLFGRNVEDWKGIEDQVWVLEIEAIRPAEEVAIAEARMVKVKDALSKCGFEVGNGAPATL